MSALTIFADSKPDQPLFTSQDGAEIATELAKISVSFERWQADRELAADADNATILAAYQAEIDKLVARAGYQSWDVVSMQPDHPDRAVFREKFLSEHTHGEDEVRFFVEGAGLFCLHIEGKVYQVLCEKNDLISVPANTRHWFDMGPAPRFTAIRLFNNPEGWVAQFTGDAIADGFPKLD
ncbi:1,2-dihydroxy-3-keto-5-methylthiopentene dioxygenase [Zobellella maritima]|uniref:1,2-dihydroxy-3-keto-5-methylthiopentene dioxygenase n=1 Tax=Zobellella maritima TaxID=2059725 RepID=UPI000E3057E2|nr:acireductone dioxygenase [Zobellella maritima]